MGIMYSILAIFGESLTTILARLNIKKTRITAQQFIPLMFISMAVMLFLFVFVTHQPFPQVTPVSLGLMALVALVSFGGNAFDYLSLKVDDLSLREPLSDFEPIVAGLVGYVLFASERRPGFLLAFLASTAIVYWGTHRRKLRSVQKKGMLYMLIAVCLYGLLPSIYKVALVYISPVYITLFRAIAIFLLSIIFFRTKNIRKLSKNKLVYSIFAGIACSVGAIASLYAISSLGVVVTMLLMMMGPALRYLAGHFLLKEEVRRGEMISSAALAVIVLVTLAT